MWVKIVVTVLALLLVGISGAVVLGTYRWRTATRGFVSRLNASRQAPRPATYTAAELERLPAPVARYFRTVLREGQPIVAVIRLVQDGEFRMGEAEDSWHPFDATQVFSSQPAGFVWDARIRMALGLRVYVRDAYVNGAESMRGALLGLVRLVDVHDTPEMAVGALQRYLAEARVVSDGVAAQPAIPGQKSESNMLDQWNFGTMPLSLPVKARVVGG
jgi:hypothetical protein